MPDDVAAVACIDACTNEVPHVTVSVASGVSPVESNRLLVASSGEPGPQPNDSSGLELRGTVGLWTPAGPVTAPGALREVVQRWTAAAAVAAADAAVERGAKAATRQQRRNQARRPGGPTAAGLVLNVFDFDATLFHTPDYDEGRRWGFASLCVMAHVPVSRVVGACVWRRHAATRPRRDYEKFTGHAWGESGWLSYPASLLPPMQVCA